LGWGDGCNFSFHELTKYGDDKGTTMKKSANNILTCSFNVFSIFKRARGKVRETRKNKNMKKQASRT
jgi:hypothetical protein